MAISSTLLTTGETAGTSATTASITPSTNTLVYIAILTVPTLPTVTGCGLTWTQVVTRTYAGGAIRLTLLQGYGAATTGTLAINVGGVSQSLITWSVVKFPGGASTVQSATADDGGGGGSQTPSVTLAAFGSAANATFGCVSGNVARTATPGSGFTEVYDRVQNNSGAVTFAGEFRNDNDTSVDMTLNLTDAWAMIATEIAPPVVPGGQAAQRLTLGVG